MIAAFGVLLRKGLLDLGRTPFQAFLAESLVSVSGLAVYWFTSRALGPALSFGGDYFTFVVIGEVALLLPLSLWSGVTTLVRNGTADGTLELFMTLPLPASLMCAFQSLARVPRELTRIVLLLSVAVTFFGLRLSTGQIVHLLIVECIAAPLFLGLGLLAAALLLRARRGLSALTQLGSLAAIFAGAYFPITTFPPTVQKVSLYFSPFTWVMESARQGVGLGWTPVTLAMTAALFFGGLIVLVLGLLFLDLGFGYVRQRGEPLLFV